MRDYRKIGGSLFSQIYLTQKQLRVFLENENNPNTKSTRTNLEGSHFSLSKY